MRIACWEGKHCTKAREPSVHWKASHIVRWMFHVCRFLLMFFSLRGFCRNFLAECHCLLMFIEDYWLRRIIVAAFGVLSEFEA